MIKIIINTVLALGILSGSALAQGINTSGVDSSGGPQGKEYLNCTWTDDNNQEHRVRVYVEMGLGLVAQTFVDGKMGEKFSVGIDKGNSLGFSYTGEGVRVLLPNIHDPNLELGKALGIITLSGEKPALAICEVY